MRASWSSASSIAAERCCHYSMATPGARRRSSAHPDSRSAGRVSAPARCLGRARLKHTASIAVCRHAVHHSALPVGTEARKVHRLLPLLGQPSSPTDLEPDTGLLPSPFGEAVGGRVTDESELARQRFLSTGPTRRFAAQMEVPVIYQLSHALASCDVFPGGSAVDHVAQAVIIRVLSTCRFEGDPSSSEPSARPLLSGTKYQTVFSYSNRRYRQLPRLLRLPPSVRLKNRQRSIPPCQAHRAAVACSTTKTRDFFSLTP